MKLYSLITFSNFYQDIANKEMSITLAYKLNKIFITISKDIEFYQTELQKIMEECAEKDGDNFKMTSDNQNFILKQDKLDEFNTKFDELQNIEIDFDDSLKLDIGLFENLKISPAELSQIQAFIN